MCFLSLILFCSCSGEEKNPEGFTRKEAEDLKNILSSKPDSASNIVEEVTIGSK